MGFNVIFLFLYLSSHSIIRRIILLLLLLRVIGLSLIWKMSFEEGTFVVLQTLDGSAGIWLRSHFIFFGFAFVEDSLVPSV